MCLGVLHYISLYALSLHSTIAHHWVPFSSGISRNKRIRLHKLITQTLTTYNSNRNLFIIINILFTCVKEIHKASLI